MDRLLDHKWPDTADRSAGGSPLPAKSIEHYRTIWISDFHLGTPRCKALALLEFLRSHQADTLFLVGDIIDGWNMGPGWCWTADQTAVIEEIWAWRRRGTRIIFVPGNHDENDGDLVRMLFGSIEYHPQLVHRTADNRRMLVIHGHQFDSSMHGTRWFSAMGSTSYSTLLKINLWYNRRASRPDSKRTMVRDLLRRRLKMATHYLVDFRDKRVADSALEQGVDGVICGHIHRPDHRMIGPILYINDGDWVQSRTALVEQRDGALDLLRWPAPPEAAAKGVT
ncbi:MAG: UDP-2,3-diacylglucosamine diphosphatase [Candidatus Binataceae bacterium]